MLSSTILSLTTPVCPVNSVHVTYHDLAVDIPMERSEQERWGDTPVVRSTPGDAAYPMSLKHVSSMGCPFWLDEVNHASVISDRVDDGSFVGMKPGHAQPK